MPKFNARSRMPVQRRGPVQSSGVAANTGNYGVGSLRDPKSELFLFALSNMASEGTFYESAKDRDDRFEKLVHTVVADDPEWVQQFIPWLRSTANMRSASLVLACEYVRAGGPNAARVVDSALLRPDEPGEAVAYWLGKYGRQPGQAVLPFSLKRGVARAATRMYTEWNAIKYDGQNKAVHFGDVVLLTRPKAKDEAQNQLFAYLRYRWTDTDKTAEQYPLLATLQRREGFERVAPTERRTVLPAFDFGWEQMAGWLPGGMDAQAWENAIPNMNAMALVRNLRNFDNAGISDAAFYQVVSKISDAEEIRKSRQFPIRFFSAWKNVDSLRWGPALETATSHAVNNIPVLPGRTLILVDRSGSMWHPVSPRSKVINADIAALFGTALAVRCEQPTLIQYGTRWEHVSVNANSSVLRVMENFGRMGGTETWGAVRETFRDHDRIVIITDEQADYDQQRDTGYRCPIYTFNLVGYRVGHADSGVNNRFTFGGGLSDACFTVLHSLESRKNSGWPWEETSTAAGV